MNVKSQVLKQGVVISTAVTDPETEMPKFAMINEIFVLPTKKILLGANTLDVLEYLDHYHSYAVKIEETRVLLHYHSLCSTQLLHASASNFYHGTVKFVTLKYALF